MTRDEVVGFLERRAEAWSDRDSAALARDYAMECLVESPTHGPLRTRLAVQNVYETWFQAFPDLTFKEEDVLVEEDRAAVFFSATGTHLKPFGNVPATGRHMEVRGVFLYRFRDGLIVSEKRYYDATSLLVQIGVLKAKPV